MENNIEGKIVVITGASSGLGEATARRLSGHGALVALGARRMERIKALEREVKELRRTNEILRLASAFFAKAEFDRHQK